MKSLSLKEENIIKDIRNLFRHKKKKLKQLKIEYLVILRIFLSIKKKKNYYEPVRVNNFWSNNYIEYESNGDRNKTLKSLLKS